MQLSIESRLIEPRDQEWMVDILTDHKVTQFLPLGNFSKNQAVDVFQKYLKIHKVGYHYGIYIYTECNTGDPLGYGVCRPFTWEPDILGDEIGYIIDPTHWNKGVASFIAKDLIQRIENISDPILALIHDKNIPSQLVVKKIGFSFFMPSSKYNDASIWKFGSTNKK